MLQCIGIVGGRASAPMSSAAGRRERIQRLAAVPVGPWAPRVDTVARCKGGRAAAAPATQAPSVRQYAGGPTLSDEGERERRGRTAAMRRRFVSDKLALS